jgi:hypothetical protein
MFPPRLTLPILAVQSVCIIPVQASLEHSSKEHSVSSPPFEYNTKAATTIGVTGKATTSVFLSALKGVAWRVPVTIGGQNLNLWADTGSSDT